MDDRTIEEKRAKWKEEHWKGQAIKTFWAKFARVDKTTNALFAKDNVKFREACGLVNIKPTSRQASRYRNKKGKAYLLLD